MITELRFYLHNITISEMKDHYQYNYLSKWIDHLQSTGIYSFTLDELKCAFPQSTDFSLRNALFRLVEKSRIVSVFKGFYVIIPVEYLSTGMVTPTRFMDSLMKSLGRKYYFALLSAAMIHGAAHQQPQTWFIITELPNMRPIQKKNMKIAFITKSAISHIAVNRIKSEVGYIEVSNPVLTATDLIQFENRAGGLNRVIAILDELSEFITLSQITSEFLEQVSASVIQRLGYIWEFLLGRKEHADLLWNQCRDRQMVFYRTPLKNGQSMKERTETNRWKIIKNIATDENEF